MSNVKIKNTNLNVEKFLNDLETKEKTAAYNHMLKDKVEEARYNQERETLNQVMDMLNSPAYYTLNKSEESVATPIDPNLVTISKEQYNEYLRLIGDLDSQLNITMEQELENWSKEVLSKLLCCLKSEDYLIYGCDKQKKICNISYEELDKVLNFAFCCNIKELFSEDIE